MPTPSLPCSMRTSSARRTSSIPIVLISTRRRTTVRRCCRRWPSMSPRCSWVPPPTPATGCCAARTSRASSPWRRTTGRWRRSLPTPWASISSTAASATTTTTVTRPTTTSATSTAGRPSSRAPPRCSHGRASSSSTRRATAVWARGRRSSSPRMPTTS